MEKHVIGLWKYFIKTTILKKILKIFVLILKDKSIFSIRGLRCIRCYVYKKYYEVPDIFVDNGVTIERAHINKNAYFKCLGRINIGRNSYIDYSGGVLIHNIVTISEGVSIFTHNHDIHGGNKDWHNNSIVFSSLEIHSYVWIGANSTILASVNSLAEGCIIGAGSVLTKDTEPFGIYIGNPAKKVGIREINEK